MDTRLRKRMGRLGRHRYWILTGTAVCALAALIVSLLLPKVYRATTYVLVSESKIGTTSPNPAWEYAMLPTYVPFVDNDSLIVQAISHFHLDGPPYQLTLHKFRQKDYLDVRILKSTRLLEIDVEFPDARMAAELANYLANSAVEFNDRINEAETVTTQKFLKERLDQAAAQLSQAEAKRLEAQNRARLDDKEEQLSILLDQKAQISAKLEALGLTLPETESGAKSLEQSLKNEPRTFQLKKSAISDRFVERAAEKLGVDGASGLSVTEEVTNTTHEALSRKLAESAAEAAGQREAIKLSVIRLSETNKQIADMLGQLTQLRSEIDKIDRDYKLARESYESASRDYRNASVTVTAKSQDLKQVAPALAPERPVRPRILFNMVLATLLGLILLGSIAMTLESFREMHSERIPLMVEGKSLTAHRS